jgi:alginate O-acetyltransferase complex protein AlgI
MWITVALYWIAPRDRRVPLLALLTLIFLAIYSPKSALILIAFTSVTHLASRDTNVRGLVIAAAIAFFVSTLLFFKIGQAFDGERLLDTVVIPLGLSYYTFRCIHFLLERLKGEVPAIPAQELIGYLFFLPTLVVGPIHRIDDYRRDLKRQRFDSAMLSEGAERILYGYAKIAILSNYLVENVMAALISGLPNQTGALVLYLTTVQMGVNLYLQFSGFSDIAIGFARLIGFRVMENFNWPYLQPNIGAFWRCWHISLSQWCRDYVYGGVVAASRSPALGVMMNMVVIALWHEVSLRFLAWGLYHAAGILVWQSTQKYGAWLESVTRPALLAPLYWLKVVVTVHFVWFGFILLTGDTLGESLKTFDRLLFFWM